MPLPEVNIAALPEPIYVGSALQISCNIQLSDGVNSGVKVVTIWRRNGELAASMDELTLSDTLQTGNSSYRSQLTFIPLPWNTADGNYTCEAFATPDPPSAFILMSSPSSDSIQLQSTGIECIHNTVE